jgi:hypothetical protein
MPTATLDADFKEDTYHSPMRDYGMMRRSLQGSSPGKLKRHNSGPYCA